MLFLPSVITCASSASGLLCTCGERKSAACMLFPNGDPPPSEPWQETQLVLYAVLALSSAPSAIVTDNEKNNKQLTACVNDLRFFMVVRFVLEWVARQYDRLLRFPPGRSDSRYSSLRNRSLACNASFV